MPLVGKLQYSTFGDVCADVRVTECELSYSYIIYVSKVLNRNVIFEQYYVLNDKKSHLLTVFIDKLG